MRSISILIPTCGRRSLVATLNSVSDLKPQDEVLVTGDGKQPGWVSQFVESRGFIYSETAPTHDCGASQRNMMQRKAKGDLLVYIDDDDILTPEALSIIRSSNFDGPEIFKMVYYDRVLWEWPQLTFGNVSGQMFVPPNDKSRVAEWQPFYGHDWKLMIDTIANFDGRVRWRDETTSIWRPGIRRPLVEKWRIWLDEVGVMEQTL